MKPKRNKTQLAAIDNKIVEANDIIRELKLKKREVELGRPLRRFRVTADLDVVFTEEELYGLDMPKDMTAKVFHKEMLDDYGTMFCALLELGLEKRLENTVKLVEVK